MGEISGNGTAVTGLGGAAGYGETLLPRGDDSVAQVDVTAVFGAGFMLGTTHFDGTQLFVSTDGMVSFGAGFSGVAADPASIPAPFFAIFNGDVDTRLDGEGAESGGVWLDVDTVQDCITITWDHVGFYRRNASLTDTFQLQIFDRGGGSFDVVYRYQSITWTAGDLEGGWGGLGGAAAQIGYRITAAGAMTALAASGDQTAELGLPQALGNTGVAGLWLFSFSTASVIDGSDTADTLFGTSANDTIHGLGGSDVLMGSAGADLLDGGSGWDRADYSRSIAALKVDLTTPANNTGLATGDRYLSIEAFTGSAFGDTILGSGAANWFDGGSGADDLRGGNGNDTLLGSGGNDTLTGGADSSDLGDQLFGGQGSDLLDAGGGDDSASGGSGQDTMDGGSGNDTLLGDGGNDRLTGNFGNDLLSGGPGADRLDGGPGADTLTGGSGADQFCGSGQAGSGKDWITDFSNVGGDTLVFTLAGATRADFQLTFTTLPGAGNAAVAEALVTYIPTGVLVWTLIDGAAQSVILLQSSMNSFDLL